MKDSSDISAYIEHIGGCIRRSHNSFLSERKKNQRLDLKKNNQIAFLTEGTVSMHRVEDSLLTVTITAPAIIGIGQFCGRGGTHYARCNTHCSMWVIDSDDAVNLFDRDGLWKSAYTVLTDYLYSYFYRENMVQKANVRDVVLEHMKEIWAYQKKMNTSISVYTYTLSRCNISRSAVHKAVRELTGEGIVKVNRGKLIYCNVVEV
ncbi:helix-turn-helix domain-containing protein [Citrobacter portucalensis]|uniref:helix-turn-helix domain-containing protein n=1 Tax=Citrobacter portucalensis TaxID=1639133 RepID=UPI00226B4FD3|nr:helix-turn-helix domain-containing protein [Citrobacter portucalensis]MCX8986148.1 helix-turn-helix domain-containing protein [Citrobacter portucalensis]